MLGECNFLQLKVTGKNISDLEAFKQKYYYILQTIPASDLPKEQTLFNHLIDELEKSPPTQIFQSTLVLFDPYFIRVFYSENIKVFCFKK